MKFGIADYGMMVWDGGTYEHEIRWEQILSAGYEGIERLYARSAEDAIYKSARMRRLGIGFATCLGPDSEASMLWTSALGKPYIWTTSSARNFDDYCRQVNIQAAVCENWRISLVLHNHLGSFAETHSQLEEFLKRCPKCGLVLDTGHLAAADGDPLDVVRKYPDRLLAVHIKDWFVTNANVGLDKWPERGRFCGLGKGNISLDNAAILKELKRIGFDGWVFVEHDTHFQNPVVDLAESREYIRDAVS